MSERYVIVHRSYDPIVIEHLGEMLREAGVAARVLGTRTAALIGVGSSITELHIEVPEIQAAEATEFLESYFAEEGAELLAAAGLLDGDDGDDEDDEDEGDDERAGDDDTRRLRPILAGASVVLTFGVGHVYARRPVTALILAAGQLGVFAILMMTRRWEQALGWYSAFGVIVLYDLVGSQIAVRAHNRGVRRGALAQLISGAAALGLVAAVASFVADRAHEWRPRDLLPMAARGDFEPASAAERLREMTGEGHAYDPWLDPYSLPAPSAP
jgi:hypothetical protein